MFTPTTVKYVTDLVGWDSPADASIVVDPTNLESTSGRIFNSFHALVIAENVKETTKKINPSNVELNEVLFEFKTQGALETLNKIFDNSEDYNPDLDYQKTIERYRGLIVEVMGLAVAKIVLNSMMHSQRINNTERQAKYSMLKVEVEGFRTNEGTLISKGVLARFEDAVCNAKRIIFPFRVEIYGDDEW